MKDNYSIRMDPQLHDEAASILSELGITLTAGIGIFLKYVVRERGIPFALNLNQEKKSETPTGKEANSK